MFSIPKASGNFELFRRHIDWLIRVITITAVGVAAI